MSSSWSPTCDMGFFPYAIASPRRERSCAVADRYAIPVVYDTWQELLADERVEVLDIAVPPHAQWLIVREAVRHANVRGILRQKPLSCMQAIKRPVIKYEVFTAGI